MAFPRNIFLLVFAEAPVCSRSSKQVLLEILQYSQKNMCCSLFLIKLQALWPALYFNLAQKETLQVIPDKNCKSFEQLFLWNIPSGCFVLSS